VNHCEVIDNTYFVVSADCAIFHEETKCALFTFLDFRSKTILQNKTFSLFVY